MRRDFARRLVVERTKLASIGRLIEGDLGRDRKGERELGHARLDPAAGNAARVRRPALLGEIRHDLRFADEANRLERDELGIAGAKPDAMKPAEAFVGRGRSAHSLSLASALME